MRTLHNFVLSLAVATMFFAWPPALAITTIVAPPPVFKATDSNGNPLSGGKLFTYAAGTTTKQNTFTDSTGATANANPVILNTRGEANVWMNPALSYKFVLAPSTDTDPPTNAIWTVDNLNTANGSGVGSGVVVTGSSSISLTTSTLSVYGTAANTQTLPATPILWEIHTIKDGGGNASTNQITIAGNGKNIDGASSLLIVFNYASETVQYDGTQWVRQ